MKTILTNLITNEKTLFVNSFSVVDNVVTYIIMAKNMHSQLLNEAIRERIRFTTRKDYHDDLSETF